VSRADIEVHPDAFGFRSPDDIGEYERLLAEGFEVISAALAEHDLIFVDTKFEFGYAAGRDGVERLIYMDEVGNSTKFSFFLLLCIRKHASLRFYRAAASLLNAAP
jgi:phosphoribosylaminoimidazole-succinocarboxamide synthase